MFFFFVINCDALTPIYISNLIEMEIQFRSGTTKHVIIEMWSQSSEN